MRSVDIQDTLGMTGIVSTGLGLFEFRWDCLRYICLDRSIYQGQFLPANHLHLGFLDYMILGTFFKEAVFRYNQGS